MRLMKRWMALLLSVLLLAACGEQAAVLDVGSVSTAAQTAAGVEIPPDGYDLYSNRVLNINGGYWFGGLDFRVGTGLIDPFLTLQAKEVEEGFNTDAKFEYDQSRPQFTDALPLSTVSQIRGDDLADQICSGVLDEAICRADIAAAEIDPTDWFREFVFDANENNSGTDPEFAILEFDMYICTPDQYGTTNPGAFTTYAQFEGPLVDDTSDDVCTRVYTFDTDIVGATHPGGNGVGYATTRFTKGSGKSLDYYILIDNGLFDVPGAEDCYYNPGSDCGSYVILKTKMGAQVGLASTEWRVDATFEEFSTLVREAPVQVNEMLSVTKTAVGTYVTPISWELTKVVDVDSHTGVAGQVAGSSIWTVEATKTIGAPTNFAVSGSITIQNPAPATVTFEVADQLSDGTDAATLACDVYTLAPGTAETPTTATCTYTAAPGGQAESNTATVTVTSVVFEPGFIGEVLGDAALQLVTWTGSTTGADEVWLGDVKFAYSELIDTSTTETFPEDFTCPSDASLYENGSYTFPTVNVATLDGTGVDLEASATVTVNCTLAPLVVEKTAVGTYDRTVTWELYKSVDPLTVSGYAGEFTDPATWTMEVVKNEVSGNYEVSGDITITNPAAIPQTFAVSDVLSDSTPVTVVCPSYTVAAGDNVVCTYEVTDTNGDVNLNTVTVSAPGNPDQGDTAPVIFTENLIGDDEVQFTDPYLGLGPINVGGDDDFTEVESFLCPSDTSLYSNGFHTFDVDNTAYLDGTGVDLEASATVTVNCTLDPLDVSKTAAGTYDRTFDWTILKTVVPASHNGAPGDVFNSTWTVDVTKIDLGTSEFAVSGTIKVENNSTVSQTFSLVDTLNDVAATEATITCSTNTLAPGDFVECGYTAAPTNDSATTNTVVLSAAGNADQQASDPIEWTENKINDAADIADERGLIGETITGSETYVYGEDFSCPTDATMYVGGTYFKAFDNLATLTSGAIYRESMATVSITCVAPDWNEETAWAAMSLDPLDYQYDASNWFTYIGYGYGESSYPLVAGQDMVAGTVYLSAPVSGMITVTIELDANWRFNQGKSANVQAQDYDFDPAAENPAPGQFEYQFFYLNDGSMTATFQLPANDYYGIHANVEWLGGTQE